MWKNSIRLKGNGVVVKPPVKSPLKSPVALPMVATNTPRIVKFSGGRSSGMMLMELLQGGKLEPKRGDVIVFNNTSAEHPATYEFTRRMKSLAEEKYNIPFFWVEYQTYEDAGKHGWQRLPSYRLVNHTPYSKKNIHGYRRKGEVFEELISASGYLPNMQRRTCTHALKIFITNSFLADWLAQKSGIERMGHFGDASRLTDATLIEAHQKNGGGVPPNILIKKRQFARGMPFIRPAAMWQDFTAARLCFRNNEIKHCVSGRKGRLFGTRAISYVSYLGIRKDEEIRMVKIQDRIHAAATARGGSMFGQPPGEQVLAPLVDNKTTKLQVAEYWRRQPFNLRLPESGDFSNCVYCPLKGKTKLLQIAKQESSGKINARGTPASINWWVKMEQKYSRNLVDEKRTVKSSNKIKYIGFFGASQKHVYAGIKKQTQKTNSPTDALKAEFLEDENYIPCNCTD